ncbi:hypothetical protein QFC24_001078 [Naganishia onofrii]|uniref:Uncharacterized protein n=1 Tax=Naganishia onofrii TaxID=1851511 RepID=A0ACC2XVJ9_9TREE|nr:hypothetical protein QFC24_001078 [Naganishia onofrii]
MWYAVYPEQIDVIPMSNLLKVTGRISGDLVVVEGRPRLNGWAMIMCEKQDQDTPANGASHPVVVDMLRWATGTSFLKTVVAMTRLIVVSLLGFHDAFGLYGRPKNYSWDKGDPGSLFFAYQDQGPNVRFKFDCGSRNPELIWCFEQRLFLDTTQASTIDPNLDNVAHARQMYANMVTQRLIDDLQGSRTTTPSQYSNTSRSTNQPPVAAASSSSLYLAQHSPEQQASPVRNRSREQVDELSSDDEEGQYEEHLSDSAYHGPGQQMASGEMLHNNDDSTPTMHPLRADTLTPITEKSDVASRKTSINTMNTLSTLDRARLGGSQSSSRGLVQQGSGSGSSHLGRNPSTGTRLIEPMVIEEVMTSSPATSAQPQLPSDETLNVVSENTVTPRNSNFDPRDMVYQHESHAPITATETRGFTDMPATAQQPIEVVAPKPQKPSDAFDEATVLQDNAYLLDQIALVASPEKGRATISPHPPGKSVDSLDSTSPSGDPEKSARSLLGRKPSGARAMPAKRQASGASQVPSLEPVYDDQRPVTPPASSPVTMPRQPAHMANHNGIAPSPSLNADAMAAMTFLDGAASPRKTREPSPLAVKRQPDEQDQGDQKAAYRSSFAPSRAAQDRRVRAQEAEKHRDDVMTKPGVRRAPVHRKKADWSASSDDEDSEEEDENSESDSEAEQEKRSTAPPTRPSSVTGPRNEIPQAASQMSLGRGGNGRPLPNPDDSRRVSRNLPPIPGTQRALSAAYPEFRTQPLALPDNQRSASWTHQDAPGMTSTMPAQNSPLSSAYNSGDEARLAAPAYRPPPRKNMWNSDLDAPHVGIEPNELSQKFVQLEPGNAQMTKAFTPHGLLQAGLQDKEDRSAKKQEENAKETGSSLVNVPNKPPPPQAGLLGAITAHERDRKAPGGIGAALTERERDRRLAVSWWDYRMRRWLY